MNKIQQIWENKRWPIRSGIYFANGTVDLLNVLMPWESSEKGISIRVLSSVKLEEVEEFKRNETSYMGWECKESYIELDLCILAGGGSHGSEGFIAVIQTSTQLLVWLAYLDCSNPFAKVSLKNGIVTAISNLGHTWHLPLNKPATLTADLSENDQ